MMAGNSRSLSRVACRRAPLVISSRSWLTAAFIRRVPISILGGRGLATASRCMVPIASGAVARSRSVRAARKLFRIL